MDVYILTRTYSDFETTKLSTKLFSTYEAAYKCLKSSMIQDLASHDTFLSRKDETWTLKCWNRTITYNIEHHTIETIE